MGDVVHFDEHDGSRWFNIIALCLGCFHRWIGTVSHKTSLFQLECPHCGEFNSFASFIPDEYLEAYA